MEYDQVKTPTAIAWENSIAAALLTWYEDYEYMLRLQFMPTTEFTIWENILRPRFGKMSPETAKALLDFSIPEAERARMKMLLAKAKAGTITREESLDLDEYERAGNMMSVLKAKARRILNSKSR
jgi:hypothetical protein